MAIRVLFAAIALITGIDAAYGQPRKLTLNQAIQAALENNAEIQISEEHQIQARARVGEQRSVLLPNLEGVISHTNQTINLGSRGLDFPGLPATVGPFNNTEARLQFSEPLDLSLIRRYQAAKRAADSSVFDTEALKKRVASLAARLYFNVLRSGAMIDSMRAQIELDESLLKLARDREQAGAGTGLEVTRAESRVAVDRHSLLQAQNERRTAELRLLRAMGERLDQQIEFVDSLAPGNLSIAPTDEAVRIAVENRPELKAEEKRLEAARSTFGAARAELFPSLRAFADYGNSGDLDVFVPTRTIGVQLNVPLFDSGRRAAHRQAAQSQLRQTQVRLRDLRDEVEFEVRVAVDNVASTREQLRSAEEGLRLAQQDLELSRLRFEAQVSTQIDVVAAQAQLSAARSRQVDALFALRSAELEYQRALGLEIR
jgi:outer membrane protein TolC